MNAKKAINLVFALALGLAMFVPAMRATVTEEEESHLTFMKPLRISDTIVLPPGTYVFRLAGESAAAPMDVVEILDNNGKHIATVLTQATERSLPHYRYRDKTGTNAEYSEATLNLVQGTDEDTLLKWFYPGDRVGHRFLYSEDRQQTLSQLPIVTMMVSH